MTRSDSNMNRRDFLGLAAKAMLVGALPAIAEEQSGRDVYTPPEPDDYDRYDFVLPRVRLRELPYHGMGEGPDRWNVRPGGDANLLRELSRTIRCRVKPIEATVDWTPQYAAAGQFNAIVDFTDRDRLRKYPFLLMTSENGYEFTDSEKENIKDYVAAGGFILMDDCVVGSGGDFFYQCSYRLLEEVFGPGAVQVIPSDHEVFNNVYDLSETGLPALHYGGSIYPAGFSRPHGQNHGARGVFMRDRLAIFLSSTDLHCGWCDSHGVEWGNDGYRRTIQMGINIIMYALTH